MSGFVERGVLGVVCACRKEVGVMQLLECMCAGVLCEVRSVFWVLGG